MKKLLLPCLLTVFTVGCRQVTPKGVPDDPYANLANWQQLTATANPRLVPVFWKETADCYLGLLQDPSNSQLVTSFYYRKPLNGGSMSHGVDFFDLSGRPLDWNPGPFFSLDVKRKDSWGFASKEITTRYLIGHYYGKEALLSKVRGLIVRITDPQGRTTRLQITRDAASQDWVMKTMP